MRRLLDWLRGRSEPTPPAPPALRNKPGGMAWIRGMSDLQGGHELNGRAVRTLRVVHERFWIIDPPQSYLALEDVLYVDTGEFVKGGLPVFVIAICDECLDPWKDDGVTTEEVRALFDPAPAASVAE